MSVFNTNCPHCNGELEVQDEYIGMTLECPLCQREFVLQKKEAVPTEKTCPSCGNMINIQATRCKFCKKDITQFSTTPSNAVSEKKPKGKRIVLFSILGVLLVILITGGLFIANHIREQQVIEMRIKLAENTLNDVSADDLTCEMSITMLESLVHNASSSAKERIKKLILQLQAKKEAVTQIPSRQAVAQLRFNNSEYQTNIAVRKKINLNNSCSILVYPVERKEHAKNISNKIAGIRDSFNQYKHHLNEAKRFNQLASNVNITGIDSYRQSSSYSDKALEHVNKAKSSLNQAKNYHEEVKALMLNDVLASMKDIGKKEYDLASFQMKNNSCDISNIRGPVIILAVETINYGDGFESYQAWYMEYTPFDETTWELR
ncbi:MAG: hypothetical protein IJC27_00725 [Lentisphaeria bacterium]|nr:hypothetical protein [Lentisphaeria bacterium]